MSHGLCAAKRPWRRAHVRACALLVAWLSVTAGVIAAQTPPDAKDTAREWKLSVAVGPAFALGAAGERWARTIAEKSGGRLAVRLHPGATLAQRDPAREFAALASGAADLAVGSTLYWAAQVPELNVVGLPWLAPEPHALAALIDDGVKQRLDAAIERAGAVALAYAPLDFREIATIKADVRVPSDLAGVSVRTAAVPSLGDLYSALGAVPRSMPFAEAQAALKNGTLGAQDGTPATMATAKLDALGIRHVLLWGAVAEVAVFAVNRSAWQGLSDSQRDLVRDAAQQAARELAKLARTESDAAVADLQKRGVTVTRLTPSGKAAFAAAARGAYDKWAAVAGAELVSAAEAAVKPARPQ